MRLAYAHLFLLISVALLFSERSYGQVWSGILASDRASDWAEVGIPGGIPNRTQVCANLTAGASTSAIQNAINNCPVGQVVSFGAGTFNLSGDIHINKGIVLRGQGPNSTTIVLHGNILLGNGTGGQGTWPSSPGQTSWTGGLMKGSRALTVGSTSAMAAGQTVVIDENNPPWVYTMGIEGDCTSGNSCGRNSNPPGFGGSANRAATQVTKIVSIDSPTQITIKDPVAYTHSSSLTPQVFYWSDGARKGNIEYAGVEDMHVDANGNDFAISMPFCDYCWVKNVWVDNLARSAVLYYYSYGGIVRDSYFAADDSGGPTQYGLESIMSSAILYENNIFYNITAAMLPEDTYKLVASYNYIDNKVPGTLFASFTAHLAHNSFQLLEGNVANTLTYDNSWGSASHSTMFRNRAWGTGTNKTSYLEAIKITAHQHFMNLIANVIGDPTVHDRYKCSKNDGDGSSEGYELDLGNWNDCRAGGTYDPVTVSSLMQWGNWDAVTWKANGKTNGVRYCTGSGVGNSECTKDETGSSDPTFPALANPRRTFPASFYLSSKPSWFGSVPWPPIGPDVACVTNCIPNTADHAAMIPAQLCYEKSPKDINGYLTAFDASECYGGGGSVVSDARPAAPSELAAL